VIWILIAAALISLALSDLADAVAIVAIRSRAASAGLLPPEPSPPGYRASIGPSCCDQPSFS
jgi:hypothetical protein